MDVEGQQKKTLYMVVSHEEDYVFQKFNGDYLYTRESSADKKAERVDGKVLIYKLARVN